MKKRTKVFLGTLTFIMVFVLGTVMGATVILKFEGTETIDEAKAIISQLKEENSNIKEEYSKLDSVAHELKEEKEKLEVRIETLEKEKTELQVQIKELEQNKNDNDKEIKELQKQLKEKDKQIEQLKKELVDKDNETTKWMNESKKAYAEKWTLDEENKRLEDELNKANAKCKELQSVIDSSKSSDSFTKSDLVD